MWQAYKPHLQAFLDPLFATLACDHQLARAAAGDCVGFLRDDLGPGIFSGRLTEEQRAGMEASPDVPRPAGARPLCSRRR